MQEIQGFEVIFDCLLRIGDESLRVTQIAEGRMFFPDEPSPVVSTLLMDERGSFYGLERMEDGPDEKTQPKILARLADGKQAMKWIASHLISVTPLGLQLTKAVENPAFEFMPMVPETQKRRKRRARKDAARPLAVQLEMATALVGMIQKLDADPCAETLAEARREVSALHRGLYSDETFKKAAL